MRFWSSLALLCLFACTGRATPEKSTEAQPPELVVSPEPGTYAAGELAVDVRAPGSDYAIWFSLNRNPDLTATPYFGQARILLQTSSQLQVVVADPDGRQWGPFTYTYTLVQARTSPLCTIETEKALVNGREQVRVEAAFYSATEVDQFYLDKDGVARQVSPDELDENGKLSFQAGPWPEGGYHTFQCRIEGPQTAQQQRGISVDAAAPIASWSTAGGSYDRAAGPADLVLWAEDYGSGLLDVKVCSPQRCVTAYGDGAGVFTYATAFTAQTNFQAPVTAYALDWVGNITELPPLEFGIDFAEPPSIELAPIGATVAAEISLYDWLPPGAQIDAAVRVGDFSPLSQPDAVPLNSGWNDFLVRRVGKAEWESIAVYQTGVHVEPGAGDWLLYASGTTVPALAGEVVARVEPAGFWAEWWNIPHLWLVNDENGDGAWSHGEGFCVPSFGSTTGPWVKQAGPWDWLVQPAECVSDGVPAPERAVVVSCADCGAGGQLIFEPRAAWQEPPLYHFVVTDITGASLQSGFAVTLPAAALIPVCLFAWDEDANGNVNGGEPRAFVACDSSAVALARRPGTLHLAHDGETIRVSGMQYGGDVWGMLELREGDEVLTEKPLGKVSDSTALGEAAFLLPADLPPRLPWFVRVTDATSDVSIALSTPAEPHAGRVEVSILDGAGDPFTSAAAVVLFSSSGDSAGGVVPGGSNRSLLDVASVSTAWSGFALRDGFLSVSYSSPHTTLTFTLLTPDETASIAGTVSDIDGAPVPHAYVTWSAPPYQSQARTDSQGKFTIPALGDGALWIEGHSQGQSVSLFYSMKLGDHLAGLQLTFPGVGKNAGRGLYSGSSFFSLQGQFAPFVLTDAPYYYADVTDGIWTLNSNGMLRLFSYPGYLPAAMPQPMATGGVPGFVPGVNAQYVRCGDRRQDLTAVSSLRIDFPCWQWMVETELNTYLMGNAKVSTVPDTTVRFGSLFVNASNAAGVFLQLEDLVFGRVLKIPLRAGLAADTIAVGTYAVRTATGVRLVDGDGRPAVVQVSPGVSAEYWLWAP